MNEGLTMVIGMSIAYCASFLGPAEQDEPATSSVETLSRGPRLR